MLYDLIVIGGGPAGYMAAERASHAGMSVLLAEKRFLGGVCLNEGCIPSKTLLHAAKVLHYADHGKGYGVTCTGASLDHRAVIARKQKVVRTLVSGVRNTLKKNGATLLEGEAVLKGRSGEAFIVEVAGTRYEGKRVLIATGSEPLMPPIPGLKEGYESGFVLTNREILDLEKVPGTLVVLGGGIVGLEMASYYRSAGSRVMVVEMLDHIAGSTDREAAELLQKICTARGMEFHLNARVVEITKDSVVYQQGDERHALGADKVLASLGRRPVVAGFGLDSIGLVPERGAIQTDERGRTRIPEVYAAGDVNGKMMLAHVAYREAEVCVSTMLGKKDVIRYHAIPSVIYTMPEVAGAGETKESCAAKGIAYEERKVSMMFSGRFVAENLDTEGFCRVLAEKGTGRLLGVHMIGSYAGEMIYGASLMMEMELGIEDIRQLVFPHPTVSEVIREAVWQF